MPQDNIRDIKLCDSYLNKASLYPDINLGYEPPFSPDIIVVIPAYAEDRIDIPLRSLADCDRGSLQVIVLVVVNQSEIEEEAIKNVNNDCLRLIDKMAADLNDVNFQIRSLFTELPPKHAGVGLARKVGMDEAVRLFLLDNNTNGIIANFDGDCTCDTNFFAELYSLFTLSNLDAASIYFEHDLDNAGINLKAIIDYELHLRYFIHAQRTTGHPYIYHTVGSSMAVKCSSYCSFGGMNKRKAGEDFYFLNKIAKYGIVKELLSTRVIASARDSDRVPFGTGRAMLGSSIKELKTFHFGAFKILSVFFKNVELALMNSVEGIDYKSILPDDIKSFISESIWDKRILEISTNTKTSNQAIKRFYQWFDAFQIMKFCHFYRDSIHPNICVRLALEQLWSNRLDFNNDLSALEWLRLMRSIDQSAQ